VEDTLTRLEANYPHQADLETKPGS
jgi:hypothetical protein